MWKSLEQIAEDYAEAAAPLKKKLKEIRLEIKQEDNPERISALKSEATYLQKITHDLRLYERWCQGYYTENRKFFEDGRVTRNIPRKQQSKNKRSGRTEKNTTEFFAKSH